MGSGKIGVDERPVPGASNAIVRDPRASAVAVASSMSTFAPMPLIIRSGNPLPRSRTKISSPRTETVRPASAAAGTRGCCLIRWTAATRSCGRRPAALASVCRSAACPSGSRFRSGRAAARRSRPPRTGRRARAAPRRAGRRRPRIDLTTLIDGSCRPRSSWLR